MVKRKAFSFLVLFKFTKNGIPCMFVILIFQNLFAQSAGAVEYTDCTSAEG